MAFYNVRLTKHTDSEYARVIEMALRFLRSSSYGRLIGATDDQVSAFLVRIVGLGGEVFLAETDNEEIVGMLVIMRLQHPMTGRFYGEELAWWVEPEHRAGGVGELLLHKAEGWARENGLYMVKMTAPAGSSIGTYYLAQGYRPIETAYQKELT